MRFVGDVMLQVLPRADERRGFDRTARRVQRAVLMIKRTVGGIFAHVIENRRIRDRAGAVRRGHRRALLPRVVAHKLRAGNGKRALFIQVYRAAAGEGRVRHERNAADTGLCAVQEYAAAFGCGRVGTDDAARYGERAVLHVHAAAVFFRRIIADRAVRDIHRSVFIGEDAAAVQARRVAGDLTAADIDRAASAVNAAARFAADVSGDGAAFKIQRAVHVNARAVRGRPAAGDLSRARIAAVFDRQRRAFFHHDHLTDVGGGRKGSVERMAVQVKHDVFAGRNGERFVYGVGSDDILRKG